MTPFFLEGRVFVHNYCPEGGLLHPSSRVPGACLGVGGGGGGHGFG